MLAHRIFRLVLAINLFMQGTKERAVAILMSSTKVDKITQFIAIGRNIIHFSNFYESMSLFSLLTIALKNISDTTVEEGHVQGCDLPSAGQVAAAG